MPNRNLKVQPSSESGNAAKLPVVGSSFADWRNDEYNDVDECFYDNEPEHSNEAENCHCGAYKWSNGRWLHVSDCCC